MATISAAALLDSVDVCNGFEFCAKLLGRPSFYGIYNDSKWSRGLNLTHFFDGGRKDEKVIAYSRVKGEERAVSVLTARYGREIVLERHRIRDSFYYFEKGEWARGLAKARQIHKAQAEVAAKLAAGIELS